MLHKIQNFFWELQRGDEDTKKRWLILLSGSSMLVVLILWSFYINMSIQSLNSQEAYPENAGVLSILKNGVVVLSEDSGLKLSKLTDYLKTLLSKKNSVTIQGANFNFIVNGLEEVAPKKLP